MPNRSRLQNLQVPWGTSTVAAPTAAARAAASPHCGVGTAKSTICTSPLEGAAQHWQHIISHSGMAAQLPSLSGPNLHAMNKVSSNAATDRRRCASCDCSRFHAADRQLSVELHFGAVCLTACSGIAQPCVRHSVAWNAGRHQPRDMDHQLPALQPVECQPSAPPVAPRRQPCGNCQTHQTCSTGDAVAR